MQFGNTEIYVVNDGNCMSDSGGVYGLVPKILWQQITPSDESNRVPTKLNCLLIDSQGKKILVDTGLGTKLGEKGEAQLGRTGGSTLLAELKRLGVAPEDIDIVINTHLHADHCGWNTRKAEDGSYVPTFPRARYLIQRGEWEAATHPNERTRATYLAENLLPLADAGCLELIDGETAVTGEVTIIPTHGHTQDHASVVLASAGEKAIYLGDMIQHPAQLERAAWVSSFDIFPLEAMETKKAVVARAIAERQLVVAVHCAYPGLGYMTETADGKRKWTPVPANGGA